MTTTAPPLAATPSATPPGTVPCGDRVSMDDSDLHVLKLCLDLQMDALMLAVSAASRESNGSGPPWHRWVSEDAQLACSLATDAASGRPVPPGQGTRAPHATETGLHARYTSMVGLLTGLIARSRTGGPDGQSTSPEWARGAARALKRCQDRLAELESHPWRLTADRDAGHVVATDSFLPGELLG